METVITNLSRKQINDLCGGLILMTVFTGVWVFIAEVALNNRDHGAVAGGFLIFIVYFIISYIKLSKMARSLPKESSSEFAEEQANVKRVYLIMVTEIILIAIAKFALKASHHDNLFVPTFALIAGLGFLPIGKMFNQTFYYIVGGWMCLMAIVGFGLILQGVPYYWPNPVIGIGCALATVANGIRIIRMGGITTLEI